MWLIPLNLALIILFPAQAFSSRAPSSFSTCHFLAMHSPSTSLHSSRVLTIEQSLAQGESYALLIMDLAMPVLDGMHATEIVREHMYRGATTPIVAVSSFVPAQEEEEEGPNTHRTEPETEAAAMFSETVRTTRVGEVERAKGRDNFRQTCHFESTFSSFLWSSLKRATFGREQVRGSRLKSYLSYLIDRDNCSCCTHAQVQKPLSLEKAEALVLRYLPPRTHAPTPPPPPPAPSAYSASSHTAPAPFVEFRSAFSGMHFASNAAPTFSVLGAPNEPNPERLRGEAALSNGTRAPAFGVLPVVYPGSSHGTISAAPSSGLFSDAALRGAAPT